MNCSTLSALLSKKRTSNPVSELIRSFPNSQIRQGMKETCEILRKVGTDEKAPNALLMDPVDMAIAIRNHCKSRTGGCEGCCFDRPTSDNGDGECVLGCPEDWEV